MFQGTFNSGTVNTIARVQGDFDKNTPDRLVMYHGIRLDEQFLYLTNARFDDPTCLGPCETELGVAQKMNATTFNTSTNSLSILQNITDVHYMYYAPCISNDNLELYLTRNLKEAIAASTFLKYVLLLKVLRHQTSRYQKFYCQKLQQI